MKRARGRSRKLLSVRPPARTDRVGGGGRICGPAMRCGITGFRPTFGRVARTGAMTLCWSLDKLGPMTRSVEDALLVLHAISGPDLGDPSSVPSRFDYDASAAVAGLRIGYIAPW